MIPEAVVHDLEAALDDYRLVTPPEEQTPHGAARYQAEHLAGCGWVVVPAPDPGSGREPPVT